MTSVTIQPSASFETKFQVARALKGSITVFLRQPLPHAFLAVLPILSTIWGLVFPQVNCQSNIGHKY
jgi:hypothetical protein